MRGLVERAEQKRYLHARLTTNLKELRCYDDRNKWYLASFVSERIWKGSKLHYVYTMGKQMHLAINAPQAALRKLHYLYQSTLFAFLEHLVTWPRIQLR